MRLDQLHVPIFAFDEGPSAEGDIADLILVGQDLDLAGRVDELDALFNGRNIDRAPGAGPVLEFDKAGRVVLGDEFDTVQQIFVQVVASLVLDDILGLQRAATGKETEEKQNLFHTAA